MAALVAYRFTLGYPDRTRSLRVVWLAGHHGAPPHWAIELWASRQTIARIPAEALRTHVGTAPIDWHAPLAEMTVDLVLAVGLCAHALAELERGQVQPCGYSLGRPARSNAYILRRLNGREKPIRFRLFPPVDAGPSLARASAE